MGDRLESAVGTNPLLRALSGGKTIVRLDSSDLQADTVTRLAYNHVVVIALHDDLLLRQAWQREATISPNSLYAFGFGNLLGSLGYIESDRNPFLHAVNISKAPYECQLITITGTDASGIELALDAFVTQGLVNGIVARDGKWARASATLLDRDPLSPSFRVPDVIPSTLGTLGRIALIQASEDEYRGVLADSGVNPSWIWRTKYFEAGQWDGPGEVSSFQNYATGFHRRAYGNTVWAAGFGSKDIAVMAAPRIAKAAGLSGDSIRMRGNLPAYAWGLPVMGDGVKAGTLEMWVDGETVLMASRTLLL